MNRLFITLVGASVTALVLAVGCGSWLFPKSWEEGKRLERQNQELKASLEASRIRIENFCDYPAEALCNIDEQPQKSVSGAMADIAYLTPPSPAMSDGSSAPQPEPAASLQPKPAETKALQPPAQAPEGPVSAAGPEAREESGEPAASEESRTAADEKKASEEKKTAAAPSPASDTVLAENGRNASSTPSATAASASDSRLKKTWSSLTKGKHSMELRIAGEGTKLTAEGSLQHDPLRYEVIMPGRWRVYDKHPDNELIREMKISSGKDNTVITFPLLREPEHCEVTQQDPRTIAIIIR